MESEVIEFRALGVNPLDDEEEEDYDGGECSTKEVEQVEVDDDEDEEDVEVTLGFTEKPKRPELLLRHFFPSKAGGVPIYAPISDKESTFHQMLYLFMCPSMSCLLRDQHEQWKRSENTCRSVKVFRCQLPRSNPFYSSEPPKRNGADRPSIPGSPLCSWCGSWKGDKICSSCKCVRYCSAKHQSLHWQSGHKNECYQIVNSLDASVSNIANGKAKAGATGKCANSSLWPEYEIIIDDESTFDLETSEDCCSFTSLAVTNNKIDATYQFLSDKFEVDADKKVWASFQERITKAPEQVLRYCRDPVAKPLWPLSIGRPSKADIPRCNYCKGPSLYEFQIMPQLLYYFGVKNGPDSLDWGTIVAYTCLASCEASVSYKEEFAWVQLYPTTLV